MDASRVARSPALSRCSLTAGWSSTLMLTSWSDVSTPAELSMKSGVDPSPCAGVFDASPLRPSKIAALARHRGPHLGPVDAHRVVGLVPDIGMGLTARLHIRPDAAVPLGGRPVR